MKIRGTALIATTSLFISYFLYFKRTKNKKEERKPTHLCRRSEITEDDVWNSVIFFPDWFPEKEFSATRELIWYLEQAEKSLNICLFGFSYRMLQNVIIDLAKKRDLKIRVLTDHGLARSRIMAKCGIETRTQRHIWFNPLAPNMALDLMHHKFVTIDGYGVLGGSLNWTSMSITENFENVVITNNSQIVAKYEQLFDFLWELNRPRRFQVQADQEERMEPC